MARHAAGAGGRWLEPARIGYVNAHGTATEHGDIAEAQATHAVLGDAVPVSSLKSYIGIRWMPAARSRHG